MVLVSLLTVKMTYMIKCVNFIVYLKLIKPKCQTHHFKSLKIGGLKSSVKAVMKQYVIQRHNL